MKTAKYLILFCGIFLFYNNVLATSTPVTNYVNPSMGSVGVHTPITIYRSGGLLNCTPYINGIIMYSYLCKATSITGYTPLETVPGSATITTVETDGGTSISTSTFYYTGYSTSTLDTASTYIYNSVVYFVTMFFTNMWPIIFVVVLAVAFISSLTYLILKIIKRQ